MHATKRSQHADHTDYNEVVLELDTYTRGLPHSVEAFFYTEWAREEQRQYVRDAHASFVRAHRGRAPTVPLLLYDPNSKARGAEWPFAAVRT